MAKSKKKEGKQRRGRRWTSEELAYLATLVDLRPKEAVERFTKRFPNFDGTGVTQKLYHLRRGHTSDPKLRSVIARLLSTAEQRLPMPIRRRRRRSGSRVASRSASRR